MFLLTISPVIHFVCFQTKLTSLEVFSRFTQNCPQNPLVLSQIVKIRILYLFSDKVRLSHPLLFAKLPEGLICPGVKSCSGRLGLRGDICHCRHCRRQCEIFATRCKFVNKQHILCHDKAQTF